MALSSHSWRGGAVYVSAEQLAERYGVNKATIWRWSKSGILPKPIKLSDQCTRWLLEAVEQFDAERSAA